MSISYIIADNNETAIRQLYKIVEQHTDWLPAAKCTNALQVLRQVQQTNAQVVFLGAEKGGLNGMAIASLLPASVKIVFTSTCAACAADSYLYNTLDYLVKPFDLQRFLITKDKINAAFAPAKMSAPSHNKNIYFVKSGKTLRQLSLTDINYFEGVKEYVRLVAGEEQLLIYRRLKDIEEQMNLPFIRVHNSYIVNVDSIQKIVDNHIYVGDKRIPISEKFKKNFMALVNNRTF